MSKALVLVESPAKVKTINKILGNKFKVLSSMGHLIDLPKSTLGVDIEHNFEPKLIVMRAKSKVLTQLKKDFAKADTIYIATDPDREGEAIGWNIIQHIGKDKKIFRVTFQEITKDAVLKAFENARAFDPKKIDAQIARRILDRIVGYKISPVLWKKVGSRLSAGRVQSVALRLIVEREEEIKKFIPTEYWQIQAELKKDGFDDILLSALEKINGEKFEMATGHEAQKIVDEISKEQFVIDNITERQVKRNTNPPFITSTLQQEAFNKLKFNAHKTMMIAQQLYEGIDLGDGETVGLITYMRTDSVQIAPEAISKVRSFIKSNFGDKYLPETPNQYKSKKSAQEAHEAIRPSNIFSKPDELRKFLDNDQYRLYELIWNRFVASQMMPAIFLQKKIEIKAGKFQFGTSGSTLIFDGHLILDTNDKEDEEKFDLTHFATGDKLKLVKLNPTQHFTKPPARFSDASLVKALEEDGIGRPSTYASIIQTLVLRNYVSRNQGYFTPTELGTQVCNLLMEYFKQIMDISFTAQMEEKLDLIEEGDLKYPVLLAEFYKPFSEELKIAESQIVKTEVFLDKYCPVEGCGKQLVVKWGRRGKFISCSGFPDCKHAEPFTTGVKCPSGQGEYVERKSRRGAFFGCSKFPKCNYILKQLPKEPLEPALCPLHPEYKPQTTTP